MDGEVGECVYKVGGCLYKVGVLSVRHVNAYMYLFKVVGGWSLRSVSAYIRSVFLLRGRCRST